jgi:hypothetical protein
MFLKLTTKSDLPVIINMSNTTEVYQMREHTQVYFLSSEGECNTPISVCVKETLDEIYQRLQAK